MGKKLFAFRKIGKIVRHGVLLEIGLVGCFFLIFFYIFLSGLGLGFFFLFPFYKHLITYLPAALCLDGSLVKVVTNPLSYFF